MESMNLETIIYLGLILIILAAYSVIFIRKSRSSGSEFDELFEVYLLDIVRLANIAIDTLKLNHKDYKDDKEYALVLANCIIDEFKLLLRDTNVSKELIELLPTELLAGFIHNIITRTADTVGENRQIKLN